jgi:hypothetical protein
MMRCVPVEEKFGLFETLTDMKPFSLALFLIYVLKRRMVLAWGT